MIKLTEYDFEQLRKVALRKKKRAEERTGKRFKGGKIDHLYCNFGYVVLHIDEDGILHKLELPDGSQVDAS